MTPPPDEVQNLFQQGVTLFQQGRLDEAGRHLQQALQLKPDHVDAMVWLANVFVYQHRYDEAIFYYRQALRLNPDIFGAHYVLAVALYDKGHLENAEVHYRQALRLNPHHGEAHHGLGVTLMAQGRLDEAAGCFRHALKLNPHFADASGNLGTVLHRLGKPEEALHFCEEAIRLNPKRAEAHFNLGTVHEQHKNLEAAIACYEQALNLNPHYVEARFNLANVLNGQEKREAASVHYRELLRLNPDHAEAHNNFATALANLGQLDEALAQYRQAMRLKPDYADPHVGLAIAFQERGQVEESLASMEEAVRIQPNHRGARWDRALLRLLLGDFQGGWPEYEWRWTQYQGAGRAFSQPLWDGSNLRGNTILLYAEQGLGDTLQFVRYAPLVKDRGGVVIVECQPALMSLLESMQGIDRLVAVGSTLPPLDVQAPLLSLPGIFQTTLTSIPAAVPYLTADAGLVERYRSMLEPHRGFKVGIAWQGNPGLGSDRKRSIPLIQFGPLGQLEGIELFSLQVGPGTEQLQEWNAQKNVTSRKPLTDLGSRFDPTSFADAAAAVMNMDLVITVDTAVAHLAGALGAPVWVALPLVPDWRWLLRREDSPWYPGMRLFRQSRRDDWEPVFARMVEELKVKLSRQPEV